MLPMPFLALLSIATGMAFGLVAGKARVPRSRDEWRTSSALRLILVFSTVVIAPAALYAAYRAPEWSSLYVWDRTLFLPVRVALALVPLLLLPGTFLLTSYVLWLDRSNFVWRALIVVSVALVLGMSVTMRRWLTWTDAGLNPVALRLDPAFDPGFGRAVAWSLVWLMAALAWTARAIANLPRREL